MSTVASATRRAPGSSAVRRAYISRVTRWRTVPSASAISPRGVIRQRGSRCTEIVVTRPGSLEQVERPAHRGEEVKRGALSGAGEVRQQKLAELLSPDARPLRGTIWPQRGHDRNGELVDALRPEALDFTLRRCLTLGLLGISSKQR